MNLRQHKFTIRRNLQQLRSANHLAKSSKPMLKDNNKENLAAAHVADLAMAKREKSKSNSKNHNNNPTSSMLHPVSNNRVPLVKKSLGRTNTDGAQASSHAFHQQFPKKNLQLKTQTGLARHFELIKKESSNNSAAHSQKFNITLQAPINHHRPLRKQETSDRNRIYNNTNTNFGENTKRLNSASNNNKSNIGYFLTADVTSALRTVNKNLNLDQSLGRRNDTLAPANMMTEQDIQRLFERENSTGKKRRPESKFKEEAQSILSKGISKNKLGILKPTKHMNELEEELIDLHHRQFSKQRPKEKIAAQMLAARKMQTMKINMKTFLDQKQVQKDFADSIKFLELGEEPEDKLLSALQCGELVKVQSDPNIDKTAKFKEDFVVGKQIGEGAYASVRLAIYKPLNRKVAIKIYEKKKIKQFQRRKSVRRQIKILQQIDHPNILKIHDVIETNNHVNIIMEYIQGISLNSYLKSQSQSRIPEPEAKKIFAALVEATSYLHRISICHRDIKLENVLLDSKLNPKLIDFGFSTCIDNVKKVKMFCGTPSYMAPEIVEKTDYQGPMADVWALGVLLYVMTTGIFPFKGNTDKQLYTRISNSDYPRLQGGSQQLEHLIKRMLTIDPQILKHEWLTGISMQSRGKVLSSSGQYNTAKTQPSYPSSSVTCRRPTALTGLVIEQTNQLHDKFQLLLNAARTKTTKGDVNNTGHIDTQNFSRERIGLAETYKQNILKNELKKIREQRKLNVDIESALASNVLKQPKTCTNREETKEQGWGASRLTNKRYF